MPTENLQRFQKISSDISANERFIANIFAIYISELALSRVPPCFLYFSILHFVAWSCVVLSFHASLDPNVLSGAITRLCCIADLHSLRHGWKVLTERRGCKSVDWAVASFQWKSLSFAQERCTGTSIGWGCNDGWGIATSKSPLIKQCCHFKSQDLVWKCFRDVLHTCPVQQRALLLSPKT